MSSRAAKIEITHKDALMAVVFVVMMLVVVALINAGYIQSPIALGIIITLGIILMFVGNVLVKHGIISRSALPLWYIMVLGIAMFLYGAIQRGLIPAAFTLGGPSVLDAAANALFYTALLAAIFVVCAIVYLYIFKPKIMQMVKKKTG